MSKALLCVGWDNLFVDVNLALKQYLLESIKKQKYLEPET